MKTAKAQKPRSVTGVAAVGRALSVLTAFRRGEASLGLVDLAQRTGLVKSTIMRLAVSLESAGLLARQPDGSYRLDAECLRLGSLYQHSFDLADHVMPALEGLVADTGETASFYVRHGEERLCLFRVESPHRLRLHVQPGDRRPMDKSAIAKVLRRFEHGLAETTIDAEVPLFSSGATDPHTAALAMPVFGTGGALIGALAISGPVTRLTKAVAKSKRDTLRATGLALSRACGGLPLAKPAGPMEGRSR